MDNLYVPLIVVVALYAALIAALAHSVNTEPDMSLLDEYILLHQIPREYESPLLPEEGNPIWDTTGKPIPRDPATALDADGEPIF